MFFARIVFLCHEELEFEDLTQNRKILFEEDNTKCTIRKKKEEEIEKVILEYGGFDTEEDAWKLGTNLLRNIKLQMCKQNNSINISGEKGVLDRKEIAVSSNEFIKENLSYIKDDMVNKGIITANKRVEKDVLGLNVYNVISEIDEIHFFDSHMKIKHKVDFKLDNIHLNSWNERLDVVLSLLNTSSLINDIRMSFLLKVIAIEVFVSDKQRETDNYIKTIDGIIKSLDCDETYHRIKNDISGLKLKSIGKKCRDLVEKYCSNKKYMGDQSLVFFNRCYKLRSNLVHSGNIDVCEITKYNAPLMSMVIDIIEAMALESDEK